jgi:FkbM family methyltransferase
MESFYHRLLDKYTLDGFAEINEGDVVIDVGAHIGGFSLSAAKRAVHVYAIEPDPRVQESLGRTVETHDNISVHQTALNNSSDQAEFLLGKNPSENSLINVDTGEELQSITVSCNTIEDFVELIYHDSIDFLKLDAEGAEPEVIRGFGEIRPTTVAIDAGPERKQKSTRDTVQRLLESMEYETRVEYNIVFVRQIN